MSFDCRQALDTLTEQLAALPIEVHLADDPLLIERCSLFLTNALQFWHEHRAKIPSVDALTVILSHDYHHVMKTGSRDIRHLINIYGANREEVKKTRDILATDLSLAEVKPGSLSQLIEEGIELDRQLCREISSTIAKVGSVLDALQKASIKLWNKSSVDVSVIPKNFFFISHATNDKNMAIEITNELEAIGIATWRDDKDILGGDSIPSEIEKGLEQATHFGLLYTNASRDRAWVRTEFENALMLRARTGKPKIIPLLLNGLLPPTILGNIRGVPFDDFKQGMEQLWRSLGVPTGSRISLDLLFKFQQKARAAIDKVKSCHHQSYQNLDVDEIEFDELEDIESYIIGFPIRGKGGSSRRFEWTVVSWPTERPEELRPSFDSHFYTYRRTAIAGSSLLRSIGTIADRLLDMLTNIDGIPLPREISGGT